uniref:Transcription initiation factor TFIID subunit 12 n=1 Tax=Globodera rostochiensis TaxID=31243 RepID=A0A914H1J7_GLORO
MQQHPQQMNSLHQQQANFMAAAAQQQQQMHHQIRSATPPTSTLGQRQQTFSHPVLMQQMRTSPQQNNLHSPQQFHLQQQPQQILIRHQPPMVGGGAGPAQQQPQQYTHFVRQQGVSHLVQVSNASSPVNVQQQFPQQQQSQIRHQQPMIPSPQQFRQQQGPPHTTTEAQQQQQQQQRIRYQQQQQQTNNIQQTMAQGSKLSPQQELHVLQQHFPSSQMGGVPFAQQQRHQQAVVAAAQFHHHQQQQHIIVQIRHQQQQHNHNGSHQQTATAPSQQQMVVIQQQQQTNPPQMMPMSSQPPMQQPQNVFITSQSPQQQHQQRPIVSVVHHSNSLGSPPAHQPMVVIQPQHHQPPMHSNGPPGGGGEILGRNICDSAHSVTFSGGVQQLQHIHPSPSAADSQPTAQQIDDTSPIIGGRETPANSKCVAATAPAKKVSSSTVSIASGGAKPSAASVAFRGKSAIVKGAKASPAADPLDLVRASGQRMGSRLLDRDALELFVKTVDPNEALEDEAADAVGMVVDDFVDELIRNSAEMSNHRGAVQLEARDVRFALSHRLRMAVPFDSSLGGTALAGGAANALNQQLSQSSIGGLPPAKRSAGLVAHQQRMALIDKTLKKL